MADRRDHDDDDGSEAPTEDAPTEDDDAETEDAPLDDLDEVRRVQTEGAPAPARRQSTLRAWA